MFRFESLEIWKLAINYANHLYIVAKTFPKEEMFGLGDQLRRAAVSISNNIAEGSGGTNRDFSNYLNVAVKSTLETVNILYFAKERKFINEAERIRLYDEAEKLIRKIRAFKKSLNSNQ